MSYTPQFSAVAYEPYLGMSAQQRALVGMDLMQSPCAWIRMRAPVALSDLATEEQIAVGLTDPDAYVRARWVQAMCRPLRQDEVERLIDDPAPEVRLALVERLDWGPPTLEQVERGMRDRSVNVRRAWANRKDYTPTSRLAEIGLQDEYWRVRLAWVTRCDFQATLDMAKTGLQDKSPSVVKDWLARMDWGPPTEDMIEEGLIHPEPWIRIAWIRRNDYNPTVEQIDRGLASYENEVRLEWRARLKA